MDDVFRILSDGAHRRLLVSLLDHFQHSDRPFTIPDDLHVEDTEDVKKFHVEMIHRHCPMVEAAGAIIWDPKQK